MQKEINLQIEDLKTNGFIINGAGRVALRTLTACGVKIMFEDVISILLKNYLDDKKLDFIRLIQ